MIGFQRISAISVTVAIAALSSPAMAITTSSGSDVDACDPQVLAGLQKSAFERTQLEMEGFKGIDPPQDLSELSCLEDLMSGGINVVFSPPSISDLVNALSDFACDQANAALDMATDSLSQQMSNGMNGNLFPGMDMVGMDAGASIGFDGNQDRPFSTNFNESVGDFQQDTQDADQTINDIGSDLESAGEGVSNAGDVFTGSEEGMGSLFR